MVSKVNDASCPTLKELLEGTFINLEASNTRLLWLKDAEPLFIATV